MRVAELTTSVFARIDRMSPYEIRVAAIKYLAEHPEDDDEPVTEEWWIDRMPENCQLKLTFSNNGQPWSSHIVHKLSSQCIAIKAQETRGDVRRLCAALGIELTKKEQPC